MSDTTRAPYIGAIVHFQDAEDAPPFAAMVTALHGDGRVELATFQPGKVPGYVLRRTHYTNGEVHDNYEIEYASTPTVGCWNWIPEETR